MKLKIGSAGLGLVMGGLVFVIFAFIYGELRAELLLDQSGLPLHLR